MTFARAPKVYSRLSMILSLTTLAGVIFLCIYLGLAVVQRRNPTFFQYSLPSPGNQQIAFGDKTFPLKLVSNIPNLIPGPDYMWNAYAFTNSVSPPQSWPFLAINCNDPANPTAMCFKQIDFVGESYITNYANDGFSILLESCPPGAPFCISPPPVINQALSNSTIMVNYTNKIVDPFDHENPIKDREMTLVEALQAGTFKQPLFYLQEFEVITDDGWLFESLRTESGLGVQSILTYTADVIDPRRAAILVRFTGDKIVYRRSYPKIQDLLAEISGLVAVIIPIVAIIAFPYAEMKMREHMINELYEVKLPKKGPGAHGSGQSKNQEIQMQRIQENDADSKNPNELGVVPSSPQRLNFPASPSGVQSLENSIAPINSALISPTTNNSPAKYNDLKKRSRQVNPQFDEKDQFKFNQEDNEKGEEVIEVGEQSKFLNQARHTDKLNLTFGQFVKSYFKAQPEVEIIKKVEEDLTDTLDLATLAKKSADMDKLKAILFSPEERAIFDNLPTSVVTIDDQDNNKKPVVSHYKWEHSLKGDVTKVNQAYVKLKGTDEKTGLQKKLLGFYESQYLEDYVRELHPEYYQEEEAKKLK